MAIPAIVGTAAKIGKAAIDAAKTENSSAASSSIQKGEVKEDPMEIKRTDRKEEPKEEKKEEPQNTDYTDQFEKKEIADVATPDYQKQEQDVNFAGIKGDAGELQKEGGTASISDVVSNALDNVVDSNVSNTYTEQPQGSDSTFSAGQGITGVGSPDVVTSEPNIPVELGNLDSVFHPNMEFSEPSLLDEAKEAYSNDKDIDDKELPFVDSEQAAEDVEDVVESDLPDEKKEEILEQAADDDKIEEGEIAEEAGESNEEEKDPIEEAKEKGQSLLDKIKGLLGSSSASASSDISGGSVSEDAMGISKSDLGNEASDVANSVGVTSNSPSGPASIADLQAPDPNAGHGDFSVANQGSNAGGVQRELNETTGSASSSGGQGPIAKMFNDIINGKGMDYSSSGGDSKFKEALSGGNIGSVPSEDIGPLQGVPNAKQAKFESIYDKIKGEVQQNFSSWKEKDGLYYKDKGRILVTTDGSSIGVKLGTQRVRPLEKIAKENPNVLNQIEEVTR